MNAGRVDTDVLRSIGPKDLGAYLRESEWAERAPGLWVRPADGGGEYELDVPPVPTVRDYPLRIAEVLATLEIAERRPQSQIVSDIRNAGVDVIRVPLTPRDAPTGSISVAGGLASLEHARQLVEAAARAAVHPQARYAGRMPADADQYMSNLLMGQTEEGSFVLTLLSPVPARREQLQFDMPNAPDPFAREVTKRLASAMEALRELAWAGDPERASEFPDAVSRGVSANLCAAVTGLHRSGGQQGVSLRFTWSSNCPRPAGVPSEVYIPAPSVDVIRAGEAILRQQQIPPQDAVEGPVIHLHREPEETGWITLRGVVDQEFRHVRIELGPAEYDVAVAAHRCEQAVRCAGDLVRRGKSFVLENPRGIEVLPDEAP